MKKEDIHLDDIQRILFGQAPASFMIEVFVRTLFIYIILLFIIRWLGKRMSGQLTNMEMAVMLTIGAIVSVPMQVPDRGLLQGVLLLLCTVFFQRGISYLGFKSNKIELFTQGKASMLVADGILQLDQMEKSNVSRQQLYAQLRKECIFNLGTIERVYLEASGNFSIYQFDKPKPGLAIYPPDDQEILDFKKKTDPKESALVQLFACINCGYVKPKAEPENCKDCGSHDWINAVNY